MAQVGNIMSVYFRKPSSGGSVNAQWDAFIELHEIQNIKPIIDKSMLSDQQYILRFHCKPGAIMRVMGDGSDVTSVKVIDVTRIDICFGEEREMNEWRSLFASPNMYRPVIPLEDIETVRTRTVQTAQPLVQDRVNENDIVFEKLETSASRLSALHVGADRWCTSDQMRASTSRFSAMANTLNQQVDKLAEVSLR